MGFDRQLAWYQLTEDERDEFRDWARRSEKAKCVDHTPQLCGWMAGLTVLLVLSIPATAWVYVFVGGVHGNVHTAVLWTFVAAAVCVIIGWIAVGIGYDNKWWTACEGTEPSIPCMSCLEKRDSEHS